MKGGLNMIYNVIDRKKKENPYLMFYAPNVFLVGFTNPGWNGMMEVSTDAITWQEYNGANTRAVMSDGQYRLFFRGKNNTVITGEQNLTDSHFNIMSPIQGMRMSCEGSVETLLDYETYESGGHPPMDNFCFACMFIKQQLINSPRLTSPVLSENCYFGMFFGCSYMSTIPALAATNLPKQCYTIMFKGCSNIKVSAEKSDEYTIPYRIPSIGDAETVGENCLAEIFANTGGIYQGDASPNTTYWLHKDNSVV